MRFYSKPVAEDVEVPLADEGRLEKNALRWDQRSAREPSLGMQSHRCLLLCVLLPGQGSQKDGRLSELSSLVQTQGDEVVAAQAVDVKSVDAKTLLGRGAAERVGDEALALGADRIVVDAELTPSQTRNLEAVTGMQVCDREAIILNVFRRHASSRRARVQVEIAELQYLRPRIAGIGLRMDQQAGGILGSRGPGETASELLARQLDGRLVALCRQLQQLAQADSVQRKRRAQCRRIAVVGYTNAGKTSLMNALSASTLSTRDRPFETLETTSRCLTRHGGAVLLSDTVGFIRNLPARLLASFESTLAEVKEADLLLLVVDLSDPECRLHLQTTELILGKLGADSVPRLYVFNKVDQVEAVPEPKALAAWSQGHDYRVLSSRDASAVLELRGALLNAARSSERTEQVWVAYAESQLTRRIYAQCRVLEATAEETGMRFTIRGAAHLVTELAAAVQRSQA